MFFLFLLYGFYRHYRGDELSVAEVAKCMFRKNDKFTLMFDLSVAEVAEVAWFLGVRGLDMIILNCR